jgi:DNA-binding transcriptional ArsR family regulator
MKPPARGRLTVLTWRPTAHRIFNRMVEYPASRLNLTFAALSDPTRRAILQELERGERRVTEIAGPFAVSLNAVSKHVKVLERAGLVRRHVRGRDHYISLAPAPLQEASHWIEQYRAFWESRLDALQSFLEEQQQSDEKGESQ